MAGVHEVSDVEHPADGVIIRCAARQAVIQVGPRVSVPPRLGAHAARRPFRLQPRPPPLHRPVRGLVRTRGLASLVFALLALEELGAASEEAVAVIGVTVFFVSVLAHGLIVDPLASRGLDQPLLPPPSTNPKQRSIRTDVPI